MFQFCKTFHKYSSQHIIFNIWIFKRIFYEIFFITLWNWNKEKDFSLQYSLIYIFFLLICSFWCWNLQITSWKCTKMYTAQRILNLFLSFKWIHVIFDKFYWIQICNQNFSSTYSPHRKIYKFPLKNVTFFRNWRLKYILFTLLKK